MAVTPGIKRFRRALALVAVAASFIFATPVDAHSELVSSIPAAGSTVSATSATRIVLSFSEALKTGSKADVVDTAGTTVGTATIDPTDNTKLTWMPASPLAAGAYTIRWTSIATDGDVLRGTIPFTVEAAATPATSATATPTSSPSASPSPSPTSNTNSGAILPVLAAVVVIAVLALILLRGRRQGSR
jgi:copper resistance protein C